MSENNQQFQSEPRSDRLRDSGLFPRGLELTGIIVGLMLVVLGVSLRFLDFGDRQITILTICTGLAIVLAAFGARAEGTIKNWNVAGAGAAAILLYLVLAWAPVDDNRFVRGEILGSGDLYDFHIVATEPLLSGRKKLFSDYEFIAFPDQITSRYFEINFSFKENNTVRERLIGCIPTALLERSMNDRKKLTLRLNNGLSEDPMLYATEDSRSYGHFNERSECDSHQPNFDVASTVESFDLTKLNPLYVEPASAQSVEYSAQDYSDAVLNLDSESLENRVLARNVLEQGVSEPYVANLLSETWETGDSSYLDDLGRLSIWQSAVRAEPSAIQAIGETFSPEQAIYIVELTGHKDRSIRYLATEILADALTQNNYSDVVNVFLILQFLSLKVDV